MSIVATIRCPGNAACGVRWGFVVAFVCLSNVAVGGFVPVGFEGPLEMRSQLRRCDWQADVLGQELTQVERSNEAGATSESPKSAQQTPEFPQKDQLFLSRSAVLGNGGNSGSTSSSAAGPQTMSQSSMLPGRVMQFDLPLVSRLDIKEDLRLPLKLPYKLFRPPKCV